ncbi:MAG: FeoB-associated Cys-rich membrane protein [Oscillospiraceae bacterium]|nr:FeoB-associated Cys-rich membrane protein [Oscillospiraceae bacterium]
MLAYIAAHMGYIVVTLILVLTVAAVIFGMVKDHKTGSSGCGCGCKGCANAPYCHPYCHPQKDAEASKLT